ncbi:MAG: hypothetical protein IIC83_06900 [Chloroflexi bacterium]|nr:hypothetical protein [Chloroflexota bacterium]
MDGTGKTITKWLVGAAGTGGFVVLLVNLLSRAKTIFGNPLEIDLKQYIRSPNYEDRVTFIEQFDTDLERVTEAFAGGRRIYVFIDDLDRAEVPKAADLMKALSMMIPSSRNAIFILGMDREKVAAGLAVKNERLLPYIGSVDSSSPGSARLRSRRQRGLEYGRSYIEKFIQLSVAVPRPGEVEIRNYIDSIASPTTAASLPDSSWMPRRLWHWLMDTISRIAKRLRLQSRTQTEPPATPTEHSDGSSGTGGGGTGQTQSRTIQIVEGDDRETLQRIVGVLAPALDNNPRRIKHFINLFRFRAYIGEATGLFDDTISGTQTITLEQLAKYVVIMLRWPLLINDLEATPDLYGRLEETALDPSQDSGSPWGDVKELLELIRLGLR